MVDAPIASGSGAGSGSEDDDSDKPDITDNEASEDEDEDDSEEHESGSEEDEDEEDVKDEESGDEEVDITMPEDQYDISAEKDRKPTEFKARTKPCVWSDPSDGLIGLDLSEIRRLKKLARGKPNSKVGGAELEKRLREQ
jgi:U3 small nucleolar RNA-associated protein 18